MIEVLAFVTTLACASCGSGGDDPLILYPNESSKAYVGMTRSGGFRTLGSEGDDSAAAGPTTKDTLTLSVGKSLSPTAFVTLTTPYVRNQRDGQTQGSLGDPSFAGRWTVVMPNIAQPWRPQVQVLASHKLGEARSLRETQSPGDLLDVFGTGFPEWRAGVDIWYGISAVKFGAAVVAAYPEARRYGEHRYQPGSAVRTTVTLGSAWTPMFKTTAGINREERAAFLIDEELQPRSEQLNHAAFINQDAMLSPFDTVRLGCSRQAAFATNRNTARATNISLAYMRAF